MNLQRHVIIINGVNKTYQVESIRPDGYKYAVKFHKNDKIYTYSRDKVIWLTNPLSVEFDACHVFVNGKKERNINSISLFANGSLKYYAITYGKDFTKHYAGSEVDIRRSCLFGKTKKVFDYLQRCAGINTLGIDEDDESSEGILSSIYRALTLWMRIPQRLYISIRSKVLRRRLATRYCFPLDAMRARSVL